MKHIEEQFARSLHADLVKGVASAIPLAQTSITGAGVHWQCTATVGERICEINCFDAHFGGTDAEYLSSFGDGGQVIVWGRTDSKSDAVASACCWLQGYSRNELETKFVFVDKQKRYLEAIAESVFGIFPRIQTEGSQEIKCLVCDHCEYSFIQSERACKLSYHGKNNCPDAIFYWDKCELFRFVAEDNAKLAAVIVRWLCDQAMPSALRSEFRWLGIGVLADYYENGTPIEGEFVLSWNSIERFYNKLEFEPKHRILDMIAEMRRHGYDKSLRAGQSLYSLILSRSRRHGLRPNQPSLKFLFKHDGMEIDARPNKEVELILSEIAFSPQVDTLLTGLVAEPID